MKYSICVIFTLLSIIPIPSTGQTTSIDQNDKIWDSKIKVIFKKPYPRKDPVVDWKFRQFIDYCDSVKTETGWLPSDIEYSFSSKSMYIFFANRYGDEPISTYTGYGETEWPTFSTIYSRKNSDKIFTLDSERIKDNNVTAVITAKKTHKNQSIFISDMRGNKLAEVWIGKILKGKNSVEFTIPDSPNGIYFLALCNEIGKVIAYQKIVVER